MNAAPPPAVRDPLHLPEPSKAELAGIARNELTAFVRLLEQLDPGDWSRPTPCSLWDVRDVVAHQAGHIQSGMGLGGLLWQINPVFVAPYLRRRMSMLDGMNQKQVDIRRDRPVEALIAELREGTPRSIARRQRVNPVAAAVRVPVPPVGLMPVGRLLHRIFPRDMWIHRLDIADATGRPFEVSAEHDGALLAMAIEDAARLVRKRQPGLGITLYLDGPAGGAWRLSEGPAEVSLQMSVPDFMRRTSERASAAAVAERVSSNASRAEVVAALEALVAPY